MDVFKSKLQELTNKFSQEIKSLRTGRATTSLIEDVAIDAYEQRTPLKHLASLSVRPPNFVIVEVWDETVIPSIESSLSKSGISLTVSREGKLLRVSFPPLSQEQRENLAKVLSQKREEVRIIARRIRDDFLKDIRQKLHEKKISEDEHFRQKEGVDKEMKNFEEKLTELFKQKEKEILIV